MTASLLVSDLIAAAPIEQSFDAQAALDAHPELRDRRSAVLRLAYEEFCRRKEHGASVDTEEFAARFPTVHHSLLYQIGVHSLLADAPGPLPHVGEPAWPVVGEEWLDFFLVDELGRG